MSTEKKPSPPSALERISTLEQMNQRIASVFNLFASQTSERVEALMETVDALAELTGKDAVAERIQAARVRRMEEEAVKAEAGLQQAISEGRFAKAEKASDRSVIVGREFDKDGKQLGPSRVQIGMSQVKAAFRDKIKELTGSGEIQVDDGGKFIVDGIYEPQAPPAAVVEPTAQEEVSAATDMAAQLDALAPPKVEA